MESINVTVSSWATPEEAGFDPSTALDALALNAILLYPLLNRFCLTQASLRCLYSPLRIRWVFVVEIGQIGHPTATPMGGYWINWYLVTHTIYD